MINKIIGTVGKITVTQDELGNYVIDIDPTYSGEVSIHTVGSITTGLWRGYQVEPEFGGTGCNNTGVISASGDVTITGSLTLMCNPEIQSVLKVPENQGIIALQEESLQTQNCLSEFTKDQAEKAFDEIAPTSKKGQIIAHNGQQNTAVNIGELNQFLGINASTGMPEYQFLPNIYSYVVNDPGFNFVGNYETIKYWPRRTVLNFASHGFEIKDGGVSRGTLVHLHSRLETLLKLGNGLWAFGYEYDPEYPEFKFESEANYGFVKRRLNYANHITITNPDFIKGNPCISLSENYPGQKSIKKLGKITEGSWTADVIPPKFGGTGCQNEGYIRAPYGMSIDVLFSIENKGHPSFTVVNFQVDECTNIKLPNTGTVATIEKTLQRDRNLQDIGEPSEAFRHISPTTKRGDIIVRGYGDYDIALEVGNDGELLVADKNSAGLISYRHPKDIDTLRDYINELFESKLEDAKQDLKRVLKMYEDYESKLSKRIDSLCVQFDYMSCNKQLNLTKELKEELKEWTMEKINSKTSQNT